MQKENVKYKIVLDDDSSFEIVLRNIFMPVVYLVFKINYVLNTLRCVGTLRVFIVNDTVK